MTVAPIDERLVAAERRVSRAKDSVRQVRNMALISIAITAVLTAALWTVASGAVLGVEILILLVLGFFRMAAGSEKREAKFRYDELYAWKKQGLYDARW